MNNIERRKIGKWNAVIVNSDELYTISFDGEGGAIVSDESLEVAERKFVDGMLAADFIQELKRCQTNLGFFRLYQVGGIKHK